MDVASGEPLFASKDMFDSYTGWPSLTKPLVPENVVELHDSTYGMERTEVRSAKGDSHPGICFTTTQGREWDALLHQLGFSSFHPTDELEGEGYGEYANLFEASARKETA